MSEKPFLERWAGRKAEARKAEVEPSEAEAEPAEPPAQPAAAEPISEEELAALPPVETLGVGDDIRAFLRPGVPAALKNAALRRMWMLTPAIRDHKDIAVDYAWDWNTPGGVPGDGGRLDPERVAQWVRDLTGGGARAEDARSTTAMPRPESAATAQVTQAAEAPASDPPAASPAASRPRAEAQPAEDPPAPRPRHGGARPA